MSRRGTVGPALTGGVPPHQPPAKPTIVSSRDIFCLVVRISGYLTLLFAAYTILGMVLGPADLGFKPFLISAAYGALGVGLMKMAPAIGDVAYGPNATA